MEERWDGWNMMDGYGFAMYLVLRGSWIRWEWRGSPVGWERRRRRFPTGMTRGHSASRPLYLDSPAWRRAACFSRCGYLDRRCSQVWRRICRMRSSAQANARFGECPPPSERLSAEDPSILSRDVCKGTSTRTSASTTPAPALHMYLFSRQRDRQRQRQVELLDIPGAELGAKKSKSNRQTTGTRTGACP